jgi:hypothetical protein
MNTSPTQRRVQCLVAVEERRLRKRISRRARLARLRRRMARWSLVSGIWLCVGMIAYLTSWPYQTDSPAAWQRETANISEGSSGGVPPAGRRVRSFTTPRALH